MALRRQRRRRERRLSADRHRGLHAVIYGSGRVRQECHRAHLSGTDQQEEVRE